MVTAAHLLGTIWSVFREFSGHLFMVTF